MIPQDSTDSTTWRPSTENLSPATVVVTAGSGWTPSGLGVEWSAYQSETSEVTRRKNCLQPDWDRGRLS